MLHFIIDLGCFKKSFFISPSLVCVCARARASACVRALF